MAARMAHPRTLSGPTPLVIASGSNLNRSYERLSPMDTIDEIVAGLFLGAADAARNKPELLRSHGVTHILNMTAATCPCAYPQMFTYKACAIDDDSEEIVDVVLDDCADFITQCLRAGGCVYVHCHAGVSRSATIVLYWLMRDRGLDLQLAYDHVKARRDEICPNPGFFRSLSLAEYRLFGKNTLRYEEYCTQLLVNRVEGATEDEARLAYQRFSGDIIQAEAWLWDQVGPYRL